VIVTSITSGGEKVDHPTQKPISVLSPLIELTTEPGDLVLDPFAGSGSSAVAALKLGRQAHLIERNIDYVRLAQQRVAGQGQEQAIVGNTLF
jgi:site-specific DNA-methyltransferase (adenine-specific)